MIRLSPLLPADFSAAFRIEQAAHAYPWSEATFRSNHGERYHNLKLEADGELAGFAINQTVLDEATLFNIAVSPEHQGKGYGRQLLEKVIEDLTAKGIATLWLEVRHQTAWRLRCMNRLVLMRSLCGRTIIRRHRVKRMQ